MLSGPASLACLGLIPTLIEQSADEADFLLDLLVAIP